MKQKGKSVNNTASPSTKENGAKHQKLARLPDSESRPDDCHVKQADRERLPSRETTTDATVDTFKVCRPIHSESRLRLHQDVLYGRGQEGAEAARSG